MARCMCPWTSSTIMSGPEFLWAGGCQKSELVQTWVYCGSGVVQLRFMIWLQFGLIAGSFAPKPMLKQSLSLSTISEHQWNPTRTKPELM